MSAVYKVEIRTNSLLVLGNVATSDNQVRGGSNRRVEAEVMLVVTAIWAILVGSVAALGQ